MDNALPTLPRAREQLPSDACNRKDVLFLAMGLEMAQLAFVPGDDTARYVLNLLVCDEKVNGFRDCVDVIFGHHLGCASGQLVLGLSLDVLRFRPRARPGFAAVLGPALSPAEMLPAIAAAGEFVIRILTRLSVFGGVPDKDRNDGRAHACCASSGFANRPWHRISSKDRLQKKTPLFMRGFLVGGLLRLDWRPSRFRECQSRGGEPSTGLIWGLGRKGLRPQSPHVRNN